MFPTWEESPERQAGVHYRFPTRVGSSGKLPSLACQHRLADDLGAVHQPARALVKGVAAVHDAAIVPHHEIADPPLLVPGEALLGGVRPHGVEQLLALLDGEAVNVGTGPTPEEQGFALGHRMKPHQRMHGARRMAHIERALEALAKFAGRVAAGIVDAGLALDRTLEILG